MDHLLYANVVYDTNLKINKTEIIVSHAYQIFIVKFDQ